MKKAALILILGLTPQLEAKKAPIELSLPQFKEMIAQIEKTKKPTKKMKGKTYSISQEVLNAYINGLIKEEGDGKIKGGSIRLENKTLFAAAVLDWNKIAQENDKSWAKTLAMIGGSNSQADAVIRAVSEKGKGSAQILGLNLNGIPVPQALIKDMLESAGRKQKPPVDYFKPMDLPYGIKSFEIQKGRLFISF